MASAKAELYYSQDEIMSLVYESKFADLKKIPNSTNLDFVKNHQSLILQNSPLVTWYGLSPLMLAHIMNSPRVYNILIEKGAKPDYRSPILNIDVHWLQQNTERISQVLSVAQTKGLYFNQSENKWTLHPEVTEFQNLYEYFIKNEFCASLLIPEFYIPDHKSFDAIIYSHNFDFNCLPEIYSHFSEERATLHYLDLEQMILQRSRSWFKSLFQSFGDYLEYSVLMREFKKEFLSLNGRLDELDFEYWILTLNLKPQDVEEFFLKPNHLSPTLNFHNLLLIKFADLKLDTLTPENMSFFEYIVFKNSGYATESPQETYRTLAHLNEDQVQEIVSELDLVREIYPDELKSWYKEAELLGQSPLVVFLLAGQLSLVEYALIMSPDLVRYHDPLTGSSLKDWSKSLSRYNAKTKRFRFFRVIKNILKTVITDDPLESSFFEKYEIPTDKDRGKRIQRENYLKKHLLR